MGLAQVAGAKAVYDVGTGSQAIIGRFVLEQDAGGSYSFPWKEFMNDFEQALGIDPTVTRAGTIRHSHTVYGSFYEPLGCVVAGQRRVYQSVEGLAGWPYLNP
ncbi:hypothetical protein [Nonomuraea fuscirosea]|uniref:hypothetical protein n=1 Tax=Nonomuraea fuscirosea TaxID=1291556 RepID=UPI00341C8DDB